MDDFALFTFNISWVKESDSTEELCGTSEMMFCVLFYPLQYC